MIWWKQVGVIRCIESSDVVGCDCLGASLTWLIPTWLASQSRPFIVYDDRASLQGVVSGQHWRRAAMFPRRAITYTSIAATNCRIYEPNCCLYADRPDEMLPLGYTLISHTTINLHTDCLEAATPRETKQVRQSVSQTINRIYYVA